MRPLAAVRRGGDADDTERLALDGTDAERPGQPVDGVVEDGGHGAVVLGRDDEEPVGRGDPARAARTTAAGTSSPSRSSL